jgi:hypothetical protein
MELTPEQIAELQEKAARAEELEQRLLAVDGKKGEVLDEKKRLQQELQDLKAREEERKKKELEEQGKLQELLEMQRQETERLRLEVEEKDKTITQKEQQRIDDRVKTDFIAAIGGQAKAPPIHAWTLFRDSAKDKDGKTVVIYKGAEVPVSDLPDRLRNDPEYAYLLKPKGSSGGMGSAPSAGGQEDIGVNPYLPGGSLTQRITLENENPDLAAKLKREASAARG